MALGRGTILAPKRSVGTGRFAGGSFAASKIVYVRFEVEAVGATPTMTFTVQGSNDNIIWTDLMLLRADASTVSSKAATTLTVITVAEFFIDGLLNRYFDQISINVTANTNVTFNALAQGSSDQ